jgi:putative membrane protein
MVKSFFLSWGTNFVGLAIAGLFFSGIQYQDKLRVLVVASLIFGLVNALIRPAVIILSLPAIVITLGLFTLVVNTAMLYITSAIYKPFQITSLWSAVGAVMVVWLVNYLSVSLVKEPQS